MSVIFGAVLGGVVGHMTTKQTAKYALIGAGAGFVWDLVFGGVRANVRVGAPPALQGQTFAGAVNRGGFRGGSGMPFGPGPWPTQYASPPPGT